MIELLKKHRAATSILGLSFDGSRLDGVVLRRSNGTLEVGPSFGVSLAVNPANGDPELAGREIRDRLEESGIRERRCAVCVPLHWALALQTKLPDLPEADIDSFLQIEAERGFPFGADSVVISRSRYSSPSGEPYVTQVALPLENLLRLERVLKAARLKPVTFSLGIVALQDPASDASAGVMALVLGESSIGMQVSSGGGVAILRTLEGAIETEGNEKQLQTDQVARELRITLGQLPSEVRDSVRQVRIFGSDDLAQQLAEEMQPRVEPMGIKLERVRHYSVNEFGASLPSGTAVSPALSLAARQLTGRHSGFEFLPPRTNQWQQLTARYSSKTLVYAGATTGSVVVIVLLAFLVQQIQLLRLQSKWSAMAPKVHELEEMQSQIKKYRPWFDESMRTLSILRHLTEAFPEDGTVSAKTVEIREQAPVTCSGTARDSQALMKALDQLSAAKEVSDVKVDSLRGKSPLQFTFNFHWGERASQ